MLQSIRDSMPAGRQRGIAVERARIRENLQIGARHGVDIRGLTATTTAGDAMSYLKRTDQTVVSELGSAIDDLIASFDSVTTAFTRKPITVGDAVSTFGNNTPTSKAGLTYTGGQIDWSFGLPKAAEAADKSKTTFVSAFQEMSERLGSFDTLAQSAAQTAFGGLNSAIDELVTNGKLNFNKFAMSIMADLAAMQVKFLIFKALTGFNFGGGSSSGGINYTAIPGGVPDDTPTIDIGGGSQGVNPVPNTLHSKGAVVVNQSFDFRDANDGSVARLFQASEAIKQSTINAVNEQMESGGRMSRYVGAR